MALALLRARLTTVAHLHLASGNAGATLLLRCYSAAPSQAEQAHACIMSKALCLQAPQLCTGPVYDPAVWQLLARYFPDRHTQAPSCITIGTDHGARRTVEQLQSAGFAVKSLVLRHQARNSLQGTTQQCCLQEMGAERQAGSQPSPAAASRGPDVVAFTDTLHLADTRRALQAAHCHLRYDGLLLAVWTDRDLASRFVLEVEELLEAAIPGFCRYDCQRDPADWVHRLQLGGLFRLIDFFTIPHTLAMKPAALLDSLASQAALHSALGSTRRRCFHAQLQELIERHYGGQQLIQLPLHNKAYILVKSSARLMPGFNSGRLPLQVAAGALEGEKVCLFCGSWVEDRPTAVEG